jgi:bleomycin hydrolase
MKKIFFGIALFAIASISAQNKDKATFKVYDKGQVYYYNTILKDINAEEAKKSKPKAYKRFKADVSDMQFPTDISKYKAEWHNPPLSQGNTGTCWDFSTTSFYESEVYRLQHKKVKISEAFTFYNEYILRAEEFVRTRGTSLFAQGSEGNALARIYKRFGAMPWNVYNGLQGRKFHTHKKMYQEMKAYLTSVKESNAWNTEEVVATIKAIMHHHIGTPPAKFEVDGKTYTPKTYLKDYLKINPDDYVEILSYKQEPYYTKCSYDVPDNWWHSEEYYNVPLDVFMKIVKKSIKKGYTMSIGGDVSEAGFVNGYGEPQVAFVPDFDIPSAYINDDARQFRFSNGSTTDDHGMHLVGWQKVDGKYWFLIKDSSSGSRNNPGSKQFGYYFFSEDYIKLKMMGFTVHKDAVKEILKKFKK